MTLNHILEIANINNVIDRGALVALTSHLLRVMLRSSDSHSMHSTHVVMPNVWRWSVRLCYSLLFWAAGALTITFGVNLWRDHGLVIGVWVMVLGSVGTIAGNLDLIRILSLRRFGERVWIVVAIVNVLYTMMAVLRAVAAG